MKILENRNIVISWLIWHFYEMPKFLFSVWKNYIWFVLDFFSIPLLIKTFFSTWRKYNSKYPKIFMIGEFFGALIYNVFSRFVGAFARLFLIITGTIFLIFILLFGSVIIIFWIFLPFIFIGLFLLL